MEGVVGMTVQYIIGIVLMLLLLIVGVVGQMREKYYRDDERGIAIINRAYKLTLEEISIVLIILYFFNNYFQSNFSVDFLNSFPFIMILIIWGLIGLNILIMERKM